MKRLFEVTLPAIFQLQLMDRARVQVTATVTSIPKHQLHLFKLCAAARLMIPQQFGSGLPRTGIYIDADVIVQRDLFELLAITNLFNTTQWCAMAWEQERLPKPGQWHSFYSKNNNGKHIQYFQPYGLNSGVMVFDLHKWKKSRLVLFWKEWDRKPHAGSYLGDQDVLNVYFQQHREELYKLPCQWNVRTDSQCNVSLGKAAILHGNRMSFETLGDERVGWHSGWNTVAQYWLNQQPARLQPLPILNEQAGVSIAHPSRFTPITKEIPKAT
jgi:hypothetical protein